MKSSHGKIYEYEPTEKIKNPKVRKIVAQQKADKNDPFGSWTGKPVYNGEQPQQDADDL